MKKTKNALLFATMTMVGAAFVNGQVIISEDFESGNLDNWSGWIAAKVDFRTGSGPSGPGNTHVFYDPGTTAFDGSNTVLWSASSFSLTATPANPIVLSADIWYSGNNNQRNSVGLRTGADPLYEIGFHNGGGNNGLGVRILNFAGNENWVEAISYTALGTEAGDERWISTTTTFTGDSVTAVFIDSLPEADGGFGTLTINSTGSVSGAFTDLRFGGPSGVSSAGGGAGYDNISLEVIPEPSTYAAIFGALALVGAFIWRRRQA